MGFSLIVWGYVIGMLVCGAGSTLTAKGMSQFQIKPNDNGAPVEFNHPYIQTLFMFIGEFACLAVWLVLECIRKARGKDPAPLKEGKIFYKFIPHTFLFLIPTFCDVAATTLYNIGLYFTIASVYQILRNVTVIFVAMMSACLWRDYRKSFDLPQLVGLIILFIGATIIALATILFVDNTNQAKNDALGISLVLVGNIFAALFFVVEEISLRKIQTIGLVGVGNEGGWGILVYAVLLPIFNHFPDPFSDVAGKPFEDCAEWAYQMKISAPEILLHFAYPIFVLGFNFTGMEITNHVSAATRTTFDACRTILVWIISFMVGWEKWNTGSTLTRFVGFILVTMGVLIYNNVVKLIPFYRQSNIETMGKWMGKGGKVDLKSIDNDEGIRATDQTEEQVIVAAEN
ncbi:Transmembrane domain-containing protein [Spironucleus salmonicida]|uniref:Transmembrane domain-containing protein n=1 Tax=Spironucleus salmonicida TaxID=348837 RepID=V6LUB4_9EUKA|nr:Transmembrane domain-containing protein [Spironucleus salmonicida]|eukprot:EST44399.1 Transmembrane domain-containing protein [Spironucleus salmonicida]